jgi:O-antigen/teichoic acid export membrane protein
VVFNLLLVPRFSYIGAALAAMLAYGTSAVVVYFLSQRVYPIPYETRKVLSILGMCVLAWLAGMVTNQLDLWVGIIIKAALLAAFGAGLLLLRIVGPAEISLGLGWARRRFRIAHRVPLA